MCILSTIKLYSDDHGSAELNQFLKQKDEDIYNQLKYFDCSFINKSDPYHSKTSWYPMWRTIFLTNVWIQCWKNNRLGWFPTIVRKMATFQNITLSKYDGKKFMFNVEYQKDVFDTNIFDLGDVGDERKLFSESGFKECQSGWFHVKFVLQPLTI